jgi:hypothetical protein
VYSYSLVRNINTQQQLHTQFRAISAVLIFPQRHYTYLLPCSSDLPGKMANLRLIEHHTMKNQPVKFHVFITLQSVLSFKPRSLLPRGKRPWHSPNTKLGGPRVDQQAVVKELFLLLSVIEAWLPDGPVRGLKLSELPYTQLMHIKLCHKVVKHPVYYGKVVLVEKLTAPRHHTSVYKTTWIA